MNPVLPTALLALSLASAPGQEPAGGDEPEVEVLEDGSRVERRLTVGEDGEERIEYTRFHTNGQLAEEGVVKEGLRVGPWVAYHSNGQKASEGIYRRGLRFGTWECWRENGSKDGTESGTYWPEFDYYLGGAVRYEREYRGRTEDEKYPHGRWTEWSAGGRRLREGSFQRGERWGTWTWWWPETGAVQYRGSYYDGRTKKHLGKPDGLWVFHHVEGTPDPAMLSAVYKRGERTGSPPGEDPGFPRPDGGRGIDLSLVPPPRVPAEVDAEARARIERAVEVFLEASDPGDRAFAAREVHKYSVSAVPLLIIRLLRLDLSDAADVRTGGALTAELLSPIFKGHGFDWVAATDRAAVERNELNVLRWHSLWALTGSSSDFLRALPLAAEPRPMSPELLHPPFPDAPSGETAEDEPASAAPEPVATPDLDRARRKHGGKGTEEALEAALAWLVAHQSPDGRWDSDGFGSLCPGGPDDPAPCDGVGLAQHDVALTGLGLLALTGVGNTRTAGPYREAVDRAAAWLLKGQDRSTGCFSSRSSHEFLYNHAIATQAIAVLYGLSGDASLAQPLERAVTYILAARNPNGAWRYDVPPAGDNDTSVTGWMVSALHAAERTGIEVPPEAYAGAFAWIDGVTDPANGRVGYDSIGSLSSRTVANEHFAREASEANTAIALYVRLLRGADPEGSPLLAQQADLIASKPPSTADFRLDLYSTYYTTYALFKVGGARWKNWNSALVKFALEHQVQDRKSHASGSWNPDCTWGYAGGRVYATAMVALCLESYFR